VPFTGSHPAAVLPLLRCGLVPSALVIGSLVPDLPYYLPVPVHAGTTHSPAGTVGVDVALGVAAFALWHAVLAPFAVAAAPAAVRARVGSGWAPWSFRTAGTRGAALVVLSLALGAATHTGWDAFTHDGLWGTRHIGWLATRHAGLPGHQWAQYASGVLGAVAICWWLLRWWHTTGRATTGATATDTDTTDAGGAGTTDAGGAGTTGSGVARPGAARPAAGPWTVRAAWAAVVCAGVAGGLAAGLPARDDAVLRVVFLAGTGAAGAGLLAAVLFAAGWTVTGRRASP
jgi:hypothetical protein